MEILRLHYTETLRYWRKRFMAPAGEVADLYDERFVRMWEYYLVVCEIGFRRRTMVFFQMQLTRRLDALPMTRDYIVRHEESSASQRSLTSAR